jgi:hypothetical protein
VPLRIFPSAFLAAVSQLYARCPSRGWFDDDQPPLGPHIERNGHVF